MSGRASVSAPGSNPRAVTRGSHHQPAQSAPNLEKGFTTMSTEIGFIGLGAMGTPMAVNLTAAGYKLRVYNRTASKADALVATGAIRVERPGDAAQTGGVAITMLADDAALEQVTLGAGGLAERLGA